MTSKAERRRKRQTRQGPSAPRVIGANDNIATANDNQLRSEAKRQAAAAATADAKAQYERLIATGVDARLAGSLVVAKRVGGLEWLLRKERITLVQHRAGEHYGDDFAKSEEPAYRSCLNDRVGGEPEPMQETKRAASERLLGARRWALQGHAGLIGLMDDVCGRGVRVRDIAKGDDGEAVKIEAQVKLGLDFLASHYGIV